MWHEVTEKPLLSSLTTIWPTPCCHKSVFTCHSVIVLAYKALQLDKSTKVAHCYHKESLDEASTRKEGAENL